MILINPFAESVGDMSRRDEIEFWTGLRLCLLPGIREAERPESGWVPIRGSDAVHGSIDAPTMNEGRNRATNHIKCPECRTDGGTCFGVCQAKKNNAQGAQLSDKSKKLAERKLKIGCVKILASGSPLPVSRAHEPVARWSAMYCMCHGCSRRVMSVTCLSLTKRLFARRSLSLYHMASWLPST
jgi:hypothetical protein